MKKIRIDVNSLKPYVNEAGTRLLQMKSTIVDLFKNKDVQKSAAAFSLSGLLALYYKKKYQKQSEEKEALYTKKLAEHDAIIQELTTATEISKERQDLLLQYDSKLKTEIDSLESEIKVLKDKLAEFEKEGKNE